MKNFARIAVATVLALTANAAPAEIARSANTAAATSVTVKYDTTYDDGSFPISSVACSDGSNGLEGKGYSTLGQLLTFPYIGASPTIPGWNSPNCGACYQITFNSVSINVMAVDSSVGGFVLSQAALDKLTGGQAVALGSITASYEPVDASNCVA